MRSRTSRRTETIPPPPPPIPPPPPRSNPKAAQQRKERVTRRDTIALSFALVGAYIGYTSVNKLVTAPINENPNTIVTRMRRNDKGQPFIQAKDGDWLLLRSSPYAPGLVLLRDRIGRVYRLKVDERAQVDLADDGVVMALFGDGKWESSVKQLLTKSGKGTLLTEDQFLTLRI